ncbi:hypothetical protein DVH05_026274 [Phytophthora capsici]|nr:hypothetical protein DVH05_026274 [Phytophthora capsici]
MADMSTTAAFMQRWAFLEPWLNVLRIQGMNRWQHSPFKPAKLYFRITLPFVYEAAVMTLECLKLLSAVAYVDYNAWKKILLDDSSMTIGERWEQDTDNGSIVRFQLTIGKNRETVDALVRMCGVHQHDHPRQEYSEALARIAAMDTRHDANNRGVEIPVPVVAFFRKGVLPRKLLDLRDAQKTLRCQWEDSPLPPVQPGGLRCTFVLSEVNADLKEYEYHSIGFEVMMTMQQLIHDNVWFSRLSLSLKFDHEGTWLRKEVVGQLLASFFTSTRRSNESLIQYSEPDDDALRIRQQVDHLSVEPVGQTRNDMEAICSAAIQSQTVRELELIYTAYSNDSVHWWKWIAYAFFSKRARALSSLKGLALKGIQKMTTAEIEAFCGILTSENPEEELLGCSGGLQEATLSANSPIRWDFERFGKRVLLSDVVQSPSPIPFVWIMNRSEQTEWVDALVPGHGRCQVPRRNLTFDDPVNRTTHGNELTALKMRFESYMYHSIRDLSGLPRFFDAVGLTLKMLTIDAVDVQLEMILERCPNLEKLCFKKQLNTAIFSFSEYQAAGSPVPVFRFEFDDIFAFTEELTNPDNDLTKCLQRLMIHPNYQDDGNDLEELDALLTMLENNGRLEYLYIELHIGRSVKLDISSKVAFLSVLSTSSIRQNVKRQCETGDKRRNWDNFGADMVTNIFQFAAPPLLRKVYVENELYY